MQKNDLLAMEDIFETVREPLLVLDADLNILSANRSFYNIFRVEQEETIGHLIFDVGNKQWDIPKLRELLETILPEKTTFDNYEVEHEFSTIGRRVMLLNARQIQRASGKERIILLAIEDITERRAIDKGLEKTRKELEVIKKTADEASAFAESVINTVREPLISLDQDLRVVTVSRSFYEYFKVTPEETVGQLIYDLGNKQWDIPKLRELLETILPEKTTFDNYEVEHDFASIGRRVMLLNARQIQRASGKERIILLAIEDITERKRLDDLLAKSEERFKRVFETATDGILLLEKTDGNIIHANPAIGKILGYSEEDCIGKKLQDIGVSVDTGGFQKVIQRLDKNGIIYYDDVQVKTRSGHYIDTDIFMVDREWLTQCNIHDITERKKADEELRFSEERYRSVVDNIGIGVVLISPNMEILTLNKQMRAWFPHLDVASRPICYRAFNNPPREEICSYCPTCKTLQDGQVYEAITETPAGGKVIYFRIVSSPVKDQDGKIIAAIEMVEDITERRQAEEELRKLSRTVEQSPASVIITDLQGNIEYVNPKFTELTGYSIEEVRGKNPRILKSGETPPEEYRELWGTITSGGEWHGVFHNKKKDGTLFWVRASISSVCDASGAITHFIAVKEDITNQKSLEDQYRQSQKMEAVGQLAGGVAHDFNNILTAVIGYAHMLKMKLKDDDTLKTYADHILSLSDRAANLTQSLLAFSRKQITNPRPVNLNEIIGRIDHLLSRIIGEDIKLQTMLSEEGEIVMADPGQIEQVLMNLATNARDAMHEGGLITIETETVEIDQRFIDKHGFGKEGMYAVISVTDTGIGMDKETREKIFEPFYTTKEVGKGTGLGLAMAYGIVKQHEGYINVYSEPGKGTTFRIYLPLIQATAEMEKVTIEGIHPLETGTETILLAEDETEVRAFNKILLEEYGYKVIEAIDGDDAIGKFKLHKDKIQLLLLDVIMPNRNGNEVYRAIKEIAPDIKVLFTSGYPAEHIQGIIAERSPFILKPVSPTRLLKKIREVLNE